MSDLKWMRQNGLEAAVRKLSEQIPAFGICGGYQMLGEEISDPDAVEEGGVIRGMELLNTVTILKKEKKRCQTEGALSPVEGVFRLSGLGFQGYEIHMGSTSRRDMPDETIAENVISDGNLVYGSYIHGIFDRPEIAQEIITCLAQRKGIQIADGAFEDYQSFKEKQYDKLADTLRKYLDMNQIYGMLRDADIH